MSVNLFSTQGTTIYNIQEVGGEETGTSTSFIITPSPGFIIFAEQFSAPSPTGSDIYSSITFENTTNVGSSDNEVLVTLFWDGTTDLTSANTTDGDYDINIQLTYDDTIQNVLFQTTDLSFEFEFGLPDTTGTEILTYAQSQVNWNQDISSSIAQVSASIQGVNQVELFRYQIAVDDLGEKFIGEGLIQAIILNENEESQGAITYDWEALQDSFGKRRGYIVYFYYTPVEDVFIDHGAKILVTIPELVDYEANFNLESEVVSETPALSNHALNFSTNIPNPANRFTLSFSDTWAETGNINTENQVFIDVQELSSGSRTLTITLRDNVYNIVRDTFELTQREDYSIELKVNQKLPGEFVADDNPVSFTWGENGKIISNPNVQNLNYFAMNSLTSYSTNFIGDISYTLKAIVDGAVELSDLNNAALFTITQSQSFNDDWIKFATDWTDQGNGNWYRDFYIRNNDTNADRTATFSLTHPDDGGVSDALVITQDAKYLSTVDTVTAKIEYTGSSTGAGAYGDDVAISNSGTHDIVIKIKMADWENDFTLPNASQTNQNIAHTFKQYPEPRIYFTANELSGSVGDSLVVSSFAEVGDLLYNSNYDPNDSNNDHQYYLNISLDANTVLGGRNLSFRVFHAQNDSTNPADLDYSAQVSHTGLNQVNAYVVDEEYEALVSGSDTEQFFNGNGETKTIRLDWPYSNPSNDPIVGLYNPVDGALTYSAITPGVETSNGLTITSQQELAAGISGGLSSNTFQATFSENTPISNRSEYLAFWLSGSNTDNAPDKYFKLTQFAGNYSQDSYNVTASVQGGASPDELFLSSESGTFVIEMKVSDYTSSDYTNEVNEPVVSMVFNPIFGDVNDTSVMPLTGFTITRNSGWLLDSNAHTHEVSISHGTNSGGEILAYTFRVKHEYNTTGNYDNSINIAKLAPEILQFSGGQYSTSITEGGAISPYANQLDSVESEDYVTVDSYTYGLKFSLLSSATLSQIDTRLYPKFSDYFQARFLDSSEDEVLTLPDMVEQSNQSYGITEYKDLIRSHVADNTRITTESAIVNGAPGALMKVDMPMNENIEDGATERTVKIGVWSGATAPKTNLIDTSVYASGNYQAGFKDEVANGVYVSNNPIAVVEACFTPVADSNGDYTGFDWDPTAVGSSTLSSSPAYAVVSVKLNDYSLGSKLALSFDITEYEAASLDSQYTGGLSMGWYDVLASEYTGLTAADVVANLRANHTASCAGLIYNIDDEQSVQVSSTLYGEKTLRFYGRASHKFKVRNIKIWDIADDPKLRPGATIATADAPADVLRVTQFAGNASSLNFSYSGVGGSPVFDNSAQIDEVLEPNRVLFEASGGTFRLQLNGGEDQGYTPEIRKWNGQASSAITAGGIGSFGYLFGQPVDSTGGGQMLGFMNGIEDEFILHLGQNNESLPRTITLGLYDGVPGSDSQAPLATFTITQLI